MRSYLTRGRFPTGVALTATAVLVVVIAVGGAAAAMGTRTPSTYGLGTALTLHRHQTGSTSGSSTAPSSAAPTSPVGTSTSPAPVTTAPDPGSTPSTSDGPDPTASPSTTSSTPDTGTSNVTAGLLAPTQDQAQTLAGSAVRRVMVPLGWDSIEPRQDVFNTYAIDQVQSGIRSLQSEGFDVVLDLGLQYPPSWVFSLPGETRFVNQYGDAWHASLSEDVPNAVFNPAVRAAEAEYLAEIGTAFDADGIVAIRVGGLLSGELRYPVANYNGHTDSLWDYDPAAQAGAPYPGWTPGTGSGTEIRASLQYYFDSLTGYQNWLMQKVDLAFPGVDQQVMYPGWGLRPGMVDAAVSTGMTNKSNAEVNSIISSGLDWDSQVEAVADSGLNATVYTTWLDAPAQGDSPQGEPPVDYLATLAAQYGLPVAGENTGGGGTAALSLSVQRARADHLTSVMYMSGSLIDSGQAGITLTDLEDAATDLTS